MPVHPSSGRASTGKGKPVIVVDGSTDKGFKKWRKTTVHPTYVTKHMTAQELLVSVTWECLVFCGL